MEFKTIIFERYKNLTELSRTIDGRGLNNVFKGRSELTSQVKSGSRDAFFGSANTYQKAEQIMAEGYAEPLERMKKAILKIDKKDKAQRPRPYDSFVGYSVNVPKALAGIPECMIQREKRAEKAKTIHLLYGFSALGNVSAQKLVDGGVNFISLVNSLEKAGYRVKIDIVRCTTTAETAIGYICNVKDYGHKLNLLKLCFPLVHPAMLRRVSFRWCETLPELKDYQFAGGYGQSLISRADFDGKKEREFLKAQKIISGPNQYYCNVYEAFESKNVNELAQKIGLVR